MQATETHLSLDALVDEFSEGVEDVGEEDVHGGVELRDRCVAEQLGALDGDLERHHALAAVPRVLQTLVLLLDVSNVLL